MGSEKHAAPPGFKSVLVVEPMSNLRQIVTNFLRVAHVETIMTCSTPVEALRLIGGKPCELIICGSSHGAGFGLAAAIRYGLDTPNRNVPIVLLAKSADRETIVVARDKGIDSVLAVPFSATDLFRRMRSLSANRPHLVVSKSYVGPDRRRQDCPISHADRRKLDVPPEISFHLPAREILHGFIKSRIEAANKGTAPGARAAPSTMMPRKSMVQTSTEKKGREMRASAADLKPRFQLSRSCKSNAGITIVGAFQPLSKRVILRLIDMVRAGEVEDLFYVAL